MKTGDQVIVVTSNHPDISAGAKGVIERRMNDGYAVEIEVEANACFGVKAKTNPTRVVYFEESKLKSA